MYSSNCWDDLSKVEHHNVAGNGKRDGLKSFYLGLPWATGPFSSKAPKDIIYGVRSTTNETRVSEGVV